MTKEELLAHKPIFDDWFKKKHNCFNATNDEFWTFLAAWYEYAAGYSEYISSLKPLVLEETDDPD